MDKTNEVVKDSLIVCTPFGNDTGYVQYFMSCMKLLDECKKQDVKLNFTFKMGSSLITHSRNEIVNNFIFDSQAENMIFIDSDIEFIDSIQYIIDWVKNKEYFIAGTYPKKYLDYNNINIIINKGYKDFMDIEKIALDYTCANNDSHNIKVKDKKVILDRVGTGFMFLSRKLLNDMIERQSEFPDFYNFKKYYRQENKEKIGYTFFDTMLLDGNPIGEDFSFCERLNFLDIDVLVEPHIKLNHIGTHSYKGELVKKFDIQ